MPNHDTAIRSVQGLVAIVAGLGITNTLNQLIKTTRDTVRNLTSFTTRDLDLGGWIPIIMGILQIVTALRFYQATTLNIEDRHPPLPAHPPPTHDEAQLYFFVHIVVVIIEGIVVAAASFYIHYPLDFFVLFGILFVWDGGFSISAWAKLDPAPVNRTTVWAWANTIEGLLLLASCVAFSAQYIPAEVFFWAVVAWMVLNTLVVAYMNQDSYFPV